MIFVLLCLRRRFKTLHWSEWQRPPTFLKEKKLHCYDVWIYLFTNNLVTSQKHQFSQAMLHVLFHELVKFRGLNKTE